MKQYGCSGTHTKERRREKGEGDVAEAQGCKKAMLVWWALNVGGLAIISLNI